MIVGSVHYVSTQKLQRQLASLRQQEALEKERARIARDIHDQVGANLTQVSLLGELVESDKDHPRGSRGPRAPDLPDRPRNHPRARRDRLDRQSVQRHARRPDQLRLQIRPGVSGAGRAALPPGGPAAVAQHSHLARAAAQRLPRRQGSGQQRRQTRRRDGGLAAPAPGARTASPWKSRTTAAGCRRTPPTKAATACATCANGWKILAANSPSARRRGRHARPPDRANERLKAKC